MEYFIRSDQYHFIRVQTQILINGHSSVNDIAVLQALKSMAREKVLALFTDISAEQKQFLEQIVYIEDTGQAEDFLLRLKKYVIPFEKITEQTIKKLFPKEKKLKMPILETIDLQEISYLGWHDKGSNKKYIVAQHSDKLIGLQGTFKSTNQKGICAICNSYAEVGMFISKARGSEQDTFIKRGNYICQDSQSCNHNLISLDKLKHFILQINEFRTA